MRYKKKLEVKKNLSLINVVITSKLYVQINITFKN